MDKRCSREKMYRRTGIERKWIEKLLERENG